MTKKEKDKSISLVMFDPEEIMHMAIVLSLFELDQLPTGTHTELLERAKKDFPGLPSDVRFLNHLLNSQLDQTSAREFAKNHKYPTSILHGLLEIVYADETQS